MEWFEAPEYWLSRLVLQRAVAALYLVAFVSAALQFRALIGERGLTPAPDFLRRVPFRASPSLFHWRYSDRLFAAVAWSGAALSAAVLLGAADRVPLAVSMLMWALLWALYLSIVNVGQTWYAFGWESLLLETGFLVVFLGNADVAPPMLVLLLLRWLLFRLEFGAGLIKWRGDPCWRNLTCLDYHHETQPMPGPLSWFFHHLPKPVHRVEVAANHLTQLVVPFLLFFPQPVASAAGLAVIVTQLWLVASGNFAWLNWLTVVLALAAVDSSPVAGTREYGQVPPWYVAVVIGVTVLVLVLSWWPVRNLLTRRQQMNRSFNPLHLVNTYGAFGSVTRLRHEVVIEGTDEERITGSTRWREYGFKGKPGDLRRLPRQYAPYHLRLDWLLWFAALSPSYAAPWFTRLLRKLLENDPDTLRLLRTNPFPDRPPAQVRALLYRYRFTTWRELRSTGAWWDRELVGPYGQPVSRPPADTPGTP
ncbi:lipase maturation factor family protein [Streptomyces sp. TRM 70361]|uniref:lipase maturation factor family protein n=1 Tax=Streptomyces sp. TRM 70361 TaxID=3116553 RepID=UPI002E7C0CAA|nr:lipase maturation factor family protein [Streptomyces sp. TRM 70361]MEE1940681.1 lipase maturation factor family protein [Streptomyces sp. TRM 70361]